jgi:hypothetical protein
MKLFPIIVATAVPSAGPPEDMTSSLVESARPSNAPFFLRRINAMSLECISCEVGRGRFDLQSALGKVPL